MLNQKDIKKLLDKKYLDWSNFFLYDQVPEDIDPIIFESWQTCKLMGINHESINMEMTDRESWEETLEANMELINIAKPIMEKLHPAMADRQDFLCLYDRYGCILDFCRPEDYKSRDKSQKFMKGRKYPEHIHGTNSVGLCLKHDKPIQVTGAEHYNLTYLEVSCYTAPIHDEQGEIIGCIHLTGKAEHTNSHLLTTITMAAIAIETQFALKRATDLVNRSIDVMSEAALILDKNHRIIQINKRVVQLFNLQDEKKIHGKKFDGWLTNKEIENKVLNKHETGKIFELKIKLQNITRNCHLHITPIVRYNHFIGTIILLKPIKELTVLANKMSGNRSYYTFDDIITRNSQLKNTIEMAKKISGNDCAVLIQSESGTGKELFAHAIHNHSSRKEKPMVVVNCAALPSNLVESELFGYEKGAFSGANESGQPGKFELADGGTIFLDEIGELPLEIQPKLLRVLEDSQVTRLGSSNPTRLDVRVIAATNRQLDKEIEKNNFRADLYYRINVMKVDVIPLRQRPDDIELLAKLFLDRLIEREGSEYKEMTPGFIKSIKSHSWPGNVRELQNFVSKAYYMSTDNRIGQKIFDYIYPKAAKPKNIVSEVEANEKRIIEETLLKYPGDIKSAYESLGMSRATFYRRLKKYQL